MNSARKSEISTCPHIKVVETFCEECKIFACDDCAFNHIPHVTAVRALPTFMKTYIRQTENILNRANLLIKVEEKKPRSKSPNLDNIKSETMHKIDECFEQMIIKLKKLKMRIKSEIWEEMLKGVGIDIEEIPFESFKDKVEELKRENIYMKTWVESEREEVVEKLIENKLERVEKMVKDIGARRSNSSNSNPNSNTTNRISNIYTKIDNFQIKERIDIKALKSVLHVSHPFLPEDITHLYYFPNGSPMWRKGGDRLHNKWDSLCSAIPLPKYFKFMIRINKYTKSTFGVFGVSKERINMLKGRGKFIGFGEGQFGVSDEGFLCSGFGGTREWKTGGNLRLLKDGDVVSVIRDPGGLRFEFNDVKLPIGYLDSEIGEGHFYLMASLYYVESVIHIIQVLKLLE